MGIIWRQMIQLYQTVMELVIIKLRWLPWRYYGHPGVCSTSVCLPLYLVLPHMFPALLCPTSFLPLPALWVNRFVPVLAYCGHYPLSLSPSPLPTLYPAPVPSPPPFISPHLFDSLTIVHINQQYVNEPGEYANEVLCGHSGIPLLARYNN